MKVYAEKRFDGVTGYPGLLAQFDRALELAGMGRESGLKVPAGPKAQESPRQETPMGSDNQRTLPGR